MIEWYLGVALLFLGFALGRLWQAIVFYRGIAEIFNEFVVQDQVTGRLELKRKGDGL